MTNTATPGTDTDLAALLNRPVTIAVVGTSTNPDKAANKVPAILIAAAVVTVVGCSKQAPPPINVPPPPDPSATARAARVQMLGRTPNSTDC